MNKITTFGHQGDLNFRKINAIPGGFVKVDTAIYDTARGGYTLALGEHSGHAHTVVVDREDTDTLELYQDAEGRHVLVVKKDLALVHGTFVAPGKINELETDKHNTVIFTPGIYQQDFEQAYDPFLQKVQRVID